ncbi:Ig-like domain-containing protein [Sporosarcina sp.]|uniref:Ig-like domain-containing protein n=1 Tax=Sporosarcina sp. TaxID=49982 RepID=UPI0026269F45|nr:Ig-like domain-containing protein [Sporosarcina sp.]
MRLQHKLGIFTALFTTSMIFSQSSLAAEIQPADQQPVITADQQNEQVLNKDQKKEQLKKEEALKKEQAKKEKAIQKEFKSIDKQLLKIEQKINKYNHKFAKLDEDEDDDDDSSDDQEKKQQRQLNSEAGQTTPKTAIDEKPAASTEFNKSENEDAEKSDETNGSSEEGMLNDDEAEDQAEAEEDLAEELEEAVEEYNDYVGKFGELEKRLAAVELQLNRLAEAGADAAMIKERAGRIAELKMKLAASLEDLGRIQTSIMDKIKNDHEAEIKEEREEKLTTKEWVIKFNQKLDEKTLSELSIVVYDANNNLIETAMAYDANKQAIIVTPLQAYKTNSLYTLYIGNDISSQDGKKLKNSVKMSFWIK